MGGLKRHDDGDDAGDGRDGIDPALAPGAQGAPGAHDQPATARARAPVGLLDHATSALGRAAIQRKLQRRALQRKPTPKAEYDQGKDKSGSQGSVAHAQELLDATEEQRAALVHNILEKYDDSMNTLQRLALHLMGPDLRLAYHQAAKSSLLDDIAARFGAGSIEGHSGSFRTQYLQDLARNGQPSTYSRLLMALGKLSGRGANADTSEVARLVESAPSGEARLIAEKLWPDISALAPLFHPGWVPRMAAALRVGQAEEAEKAAAAKADDARKRGDQKETQEQETARQARHADVVKNKVQHLAGIVWSLRGAFTTDRPALFQQITAWARQEDAEVRQAAVADGSPFMTAIEALVKAGLDEGDARYVIALVRDHAPLPARFLTAHPPDPDHKEDESTWKVREARAYLTRKGDKDFALKRQDGYQPLKARIEAMSDAEREGFLYTYLPEEAQERFADPTVHPDVLEPLRRQALAALKDDLVRAGMDGDDADKVLLRFRPEVAKGALDKGSVYQQLRSLRSSRTYVRSKTILHTLARASGTDYYNIRNDQPLLDFIVGKLDDHEKDKLLRLLGVRQGDEVAAHGTRETRDDKVEQFEADATLQPGHHAVRLGQALGEKSPTQVFTVATEAYYAAQKAVEKQAPGRGGLSVTAFLAAVIAGLTDKKREILHEDKFRPALQAMLSGTCPSVDVRLEAAEFKGVRGIRRIGGNDAKQKSVVAAFEDLSGQELLNEWSNFAEVEPLAVELVRVSQRPQTPGMAQKEKELAPRVRDFILDVREDRRAWLEQHFTHADFVEVLKQLRVKLQRAARDDEKFRAALEQAQVPSDEYAQQRMEGLGAIDEQRNKDSGLQVGMQWHGGLFGRTRSHERREARSELVGQFRGAQKELREAEGGDAQAQEEAREAVNRERVPALQKAEEHLRLRTAAFERARDRAKKAAQIAVAIILAAAVAGATAGFAAIPMATATAIWVPILLKMGMALGTAAIKAGINKALDGDNFNGRKAAVDVGMAVLGAAVGVGTDIGAAQSLAHLGLQGATNLMSDNASLASDVGAYFEAEAISASFSLVQQSIPEAIRVAATEDPAATSKWAHLLPLFTGFLGQYVLSVGKDLAVDAALQSTGLYQLPQQNEWGGVNKDATGHSIKVDRFGDVTTQNLTLPQTLEKVAITQAISLPIGTGGGKGLGAATDQLDKKLGPDKERQGDTSIPERASAVPPVSQDPAQAEAYALGRVKWATDIVALTEPWMKLCEAHARQASKSKDEGARQEAQEAEQLAEEIRGRRIATDVQRLSTQDILSRFKAGQGGLQAHDVQVSARLLDEQANRLAAAAQAARRYRP